MQRILFTDATHLQTSSSSVADDQYRKTTVLMIMNDIKNVKVLMMNDFNV